MASHRKGLNKTTWHKVKACIYGEYALCRALVDFLPPSGFGRLLGGIFASSAVALFFIKFAFGSGLISIPVSFDIALGDSGAFFGGGSAGMPPAFATDAAPDNTSSGSRPVTATPEETATEPEGGDGPEFTVF